MSILDFEQLSDLELILNYLIEIRGRGFFFSPNEVSMIDEWLRVYPNVDELLVTLSEVAPDYFKNTKGANSKKSLKGLHQKIIKAAKQKAMLGMTVT